MASINTIRRHLRNRIAVLPLRNPVGNEHNLHQSHIARLQGPSLTYLLTLPIWSVDNYSFLLASSPDI